MKSIKTKLQLLFMIFNPKKKISIAFCLFILFSNVQTNKLYACSWSPTSDEIRFSLFSNDLADGVDLEPLFYCGSLYNTNYQFDYLGPKENLEAWKKYFENRFTLADIDQLIYQINIKGPTFNKLLKNPIFIYFSEGNDPETADYIKFAKQVESYFFTYYWYNYEIDYENLKKACEIAEKRYDKTENDEIKLRYAYQIIVISRYLSDWDKVSQSYELKIADLKTEHPLKYWSLFHYSEQLNKIDKYVNYINIFKNCKAKSVYIIQNFPKEKGILTDIYNACKTNEEKASFYAIQSFKNPGKAIGEFNQIANLDASSPFLDILLIREINKFEDWNYTPEYSGQGTSSIYSWDEELKFIEEKNYERNKQYLKKFISSCENILKTKQINNKNLWHIALSYMYYMLDDKKNSEKNLALANHKNLSNKEKAQVKTIEILNLVKYEKKWDSDFQNSFSKLITELDKFKDDMFEYDKFKSQIMLAVHKKYESEKNIMIAGLFLSKVNNEVITSYYNWTDPTYQTFDFFNEKALSSDMDDFFNLWNKKNKTELELWLFEDLEKYKWRLTDLWGTLYFRENKLEEALAIYETIPDSIWEVTNHELHYYYKQELKRNPFESNLFGKNIYSSTDVNYTKPEFIKEILKLKSEINNNDKENNALIYYLLGNAYFNMTYWGNSWYYTEYEWSSYLYGMNKSILSKKTNYYDCKIANRYYQMAENETKNENFAAFCMRMQLKCEKYNDEISYYIEKYNSDDWSSVKDNAKNYNKLKAKYFKKYSLYADDFMSCSYETVTLMDSIENQRKNIFKQSIKE